MTLKILLDTTFLLPTVGGKVRGLDPAFLRKLGIHAATERVTIHCSVASQVELLGKVCKHILSLPEAERVEALKTLRLGLRSLLDSGRYKWLTPTTSALTLASRLRLRGHGDMIDNLIYSTAAAEGLIMATQDEDLLSFLERQGFDSSFVKAPGELMKLLEGLASSS